MVTQGAHPSNAQLSERNAFTFRNCPQSAQELERYICTVVWESVNCQRARDGECVRALTSSWKRPPPRSVSNPRPSGLLGVSRVM